MQINPEHLRPYSWVQPGQSLGIHTHTHLNRPLWSRKQEDRNGPRSSGGPQTGRGACVDLQEQELTRPSNIAGLEPKLQTATYNNLALSRATSGSKLPAPRPNAGFEPTPAFLALADEPSRHTNGNAKVWESRSFNAFLCSKVTMPCSRCRQP